MAAGHRKQLLMRGHAAAHWCFVFVWLEINQALSFARLWQIGADVRGLARQG